MLIKVVSKTYQIQISEWRVNSKHFIYDMPDFESALARSCPSRASYFQVILSNILTLMYDE